MDIVNEDFSIRISMLASGSSGNVTYIETPKRKILVDAGLSGTKIRQALMKVNRDISEIDSIFITHEHTDHIKGLGVLARKYDVDLYANELTWRAIGEKCGSIDDKQKHIMEIGEIITLGDVDIMSYGVSHDAVNPQFYAFQKDNKQFAMLTDTGYVSDRLRSLLCNSDAYLIESNHDLDMLRMGRYPWSLKQRILGDEGHLSNDDGALAMVEMIGEQTKRIYLGHLSRDNNMKKIAQQTFTSILQENDLAVNQAFHIYDTDPEEPTQLFAL